MQYTRPHNIFVRCPNWAGDIVMATPVFRCLRHNFPESRITACVRRYAQGILQDNDDIDEIFPCHDKSFAGLRETIRQIRKEAPDTAVLLPNSFRVWLEARLGKAEKIYGYRRGVRKMFMPSGTEAEHEGGKVMPVPMTEYYLGICRSMGLTLPENCKPALQVSKKLQAEGDSILQNNGVNPQGMFIGLNPGASFGSSKCWPIENFARLAELAQRRWECPIVLFGSPGEKDITQAIVERSAATIVDTAPLGIDLAYLKPLIRRCSLLITNDTGPRHYAVAFDVPAVVIMGPTDPRYTASNLEKTAVVREEVDCGPCHKKVCPRDHICMTRITPERVCEEAQKLLERIT